LTVTVQEQIAIAIQSTIVLTSVFGNSTDRL